MAGDVMFAELHMLSGERQETSNLVGIATSPVLSLFKRRRGQLFTIVDPSRPGADLMCRRLIETIEDEYFRGSYRSITTGLRQAVTAANERLLAENSRLPPDKQLRVGLSCAVIREGDVYVAQVAPANAFILHEGSIKRVFSTYGLVPETSGNGTNRASDSLGARLDAQVNFGYSPLCEDDLVVLASGAYWKLIPDRYILESARHVDPEVAASELYTHYLSHARRPTTSLIVIRVSELPVAGPRNGDGKRIARRNGKRAEQSPVVLQASQVALRPTEAGERQGSPSAPTKKKGETHPSGRFGWLKFGRGQSAKSSYSGGPRLERVGKPSVRLRERPPQMRADRRVVPAWVVQLVLMLVLAAAIVALSNWGVSLWNSWQLGDPVALAQQAQEKRTLAGTAGNEVAARALLAESHQLFGRALRARDDEATRAQAAAVQADIDRIDRTVRIGQARVLVDYSPIVDDKGDVTQLVLDGNNVYVLDEALDRMYKYILSPDGKGVQEPGKHQVLARRGDKLDGYPMGDLLALAWMPAGQLRTSPALLALEAGRSLITYDPKVGLGRIEVPESQRWGTIQAVTGFAGGLYLLDTKLKAVVYHPPTKNGYESRPFTIVDPAARVDLSKSVDIALDGSLYVLEGSGAVKRFNLQGRQLDFPGELPDGPAKGPKAIFANAYTRSLYVVDNVGERIVQFSVEGKLQRQFKADGKNVSFQDLRDIFVDEAGRKLYALARKSLFVFDLPPIQ